MRRTTMTFAAIAVALAFSSGAFAGWDSNYYSGIPCEGYDQTTRDGMIQETDPAYGGGWIHNNSAIQNDYICWIHNDHAGDLGKPAPEPQVNWVYVVDHSTSAVTCYIVNHSSSSLSYSASVSASTSSVDSATPSVLVFSNLSVSYSTGYNYLRCVIPAQDGSGNDSGIVSYGIIEENP